MQKKETKAERESSQTKILVVNKSCSANTAALFAFEALRLPNSNME